jgi:uncharacterized protein YbjT (DUF2867 family)
MPSDAIIAGATGLVGRECLRLLLDGYDSVTALVRRPFQQSHPKLIARQIDFDRLGTIDIPARAHVYCTLGTTIKKAGSDEAFKIVDYEYPRMLASRAAAAGGARFMLVSSVSASPSSKNFYLRVKGELEEAVRAMPLQAAHIFRPSFLIGDRAEKRPGEAVGIVTAKVINPLLFGPLRKYRAIPASIVAAAMVATANQGEQESRIYHYDEMLCLAGSLKVIHDRDS